MRYRHVLQGLSVVLMLVVFSCQKEHQQPQPQPVQPPIAVTKHILLKDITIPHLPSPYYHFEYNADSLVIKANFDSGLTNYDFVYSGNNIREMRNNIIVNHDTLRYFNDNTGKVNAINFINENNITYRRVNFTYTGEQINLIRWDRLSGTRFSVDREVVFSFYADGNVKTITDRRLAQAGQPERTFVTSFEQYDGKINVDDFSLIHDGIHDHLFLLQGFRLQRSNPKKETFTIDGAPYYTVNYSYVYNADNTPVTKTGDLLFTGGTDAGKKFQTNEMFTYY